MEGNRHISVEDCVSNGLKRASRSFEDVAQFRFGNGSNKSKFIHEEIKSILNSGNTYYHSVQKFSLLICCLKRKN
jgi:hypothetical protein